MKEKVAKIIRNIWFFVLIKPKVSFLKFFGASIGHNCRLYNSISNYDLRYLKWLTIGNEVIIAKNTLIFTHDASVKNMKRFGIVKEEFRKVTIGNNVFIGAGSIILPGVAIGDNSIIGAGSIVTNDVPKNCITVGNPAKIIRSFKNV